MASGSTKVALRKVKPLLSLDKIEARKRVFNLYKAWYRQIPFIVIDYHVPYNVKQLREKLKQEFKKNQHVTDIRVIDMLVIKGQMELQEVVNKWKNSLHISYFFKDTAIPKPTDFMSKFLSGKE